MRSLTIVGIIGAVLAWERSSYGQTTSLPSRAKPPAFAPDQFNGLFFTDISTVLKGPRPENQAGQSSVGLTSDSNGAAAFPKSTENRESEDNSLHIQPEVDWQALISGQSLEDLIKESKLRLDKIVTTPAAFAGGGFAEARKEFSLLAVLFDVIDQHRQPVRWQKSAGAARILMSRVAANTKIGSRQVFDEAQQRLQDLEQLLSGSTLSQPIGTENASGNLIDLVPLMQLLERSYSEVIKPYSANDSEFKKHVAELERNAQLVSVLGKVAQSENMPYSDDSAFVDLAGQMLLQAQEIVQSVQKEQPQAARISSGQLGQTCIHCHENYR